jgi:hypothetical protein
MSVLSPPDRTELDELRARRAAIKRLARLDAAAAAELPYVDRYYKQRLALFIAQRLDRAEGPRLLRPLGGAGGLSACVAGLWIAAAGPLAGVSAAVDVGVWIAGLVIATGVTRRGTVLGSLLRRPLDRLLEEGGAAATPGRGVEASAVELTGHEVEGRQRLERGVQLAEVAAVELKGREVLPVAAVRAPEVATVAAVDGASPIAVGAVAIRAPESLRVAEPGVAERELRGLATQAGARRPAPVVAEAAGPRDPESLLAWVKEVGAQGDPESLREAMDVARGEYQTWAEVRGRGATEQLQPVDGGPPSGVGAEEVPGGLGAVARARGRRALGARASRRSGGHAVAAVAVADEATAASDPSPEFQTEPLLSEEEAVELSRLGDLYAGEDFGLSA